VTVADPDATRREAVRRGMKAGGAALGAAMLPAMLSQRDALAAAPASDAAILAPAIRLENTAVSLYAAAAANAALPPRFRRTAALFRGQEAVHVATLGAALKAAGATPSTATDAALLARLRQARDEQQVARLALELESRLVAAYYDAAQTLRQPRLLGTIGQIIGSEGQHLVVLRQGLSRDPVPQAFEKGSRSG
jgi:rubrerythrin